MNYIRKKQINELADIIRKSLQLDNAPYNPEIAVKRLGGTVIENNLPNEIDAYIVKNGTDSFSITLNSNGVYERKMFSLAHEMGHLFLHMGFLINRDKWEKISNKFEDSLYTRMAGKYSIEENEANEFAAAFLMPENEFKNIINKSVDLNKITEHFKVSEEAVINRGKWLGLFKW